MKKDPLRNGEGLVFGFVKPVVGTFRRLPKTLEQNAEERDEQDERHQGSGHRESLRAISSTILAISSSPSPCTEG